METKSNAAILEELTGATCGLVVEEPFYGHFFSGMLKEVHEGIQTMAIGPSGNHIKLHINPKFWSHVLTTQGLRRGLIKHELLHVVFKHIFRGKGFPNKALFNIAADLVVNQYIRQERLPESRVHLGLFPELAMEPDKEAEYYYAQLAKFHDEMSQLGTAGEGKSESGESGQNRSEQNDDLTQDQEKQDHPGGTSWENLKKLLSEEDEWQEKHGLWSEISQLPQALQEVLESAVDQAISSSVDRARVKGWGTLPGKLREYLDRFQVEGPPSVNWRRILRLFTESSSRTYLRNTLKRPSKRYGTTPGTRIRRRQKLLLAIDTSGSINQKDLREFFREIYYIWKRGAEIMVVENDTRIHKTYPFRGRWPDIIEGRGGTDFNAPIKYGNQQFHPDALIYFTDGFAPPPRIRARYPLLWVVSSGGIHADTEGFRALPGMRVKMVQ